MVWVLEAIADGMGPGGDQAPAGDGRQADEVNSAPKNDMILTSTSIAAKFLIVKNGNSFQEKTMFSRKMYCLLAATFSVVAAGAQQPAATPKTKGGYPLVQQLDKTVTYASAADVAALIDKAGKESKNGSAIVVGAFLKLDPYTVNIEYRKKGGIGDVGLHPKSAELIYFLQGSGTIVLGGKMAADRMSIDGGQSQKIGKGGFILIPEGVPHWINHVDRTIVLMSVFVPRPVPAP